MTSTRYYITNEPCLKRNLPNKPYYSSSKKSSHDTAVNEDIALVLSEFQFDMDFHNVPPVDVKVRDLSLAITPPPPILQRLHLRRGAAVEPKQILRNVSLDVPRGSLMAIIGASGSGKVFLLLSKLIRLRC